MIINLLIILVILISVGMSALYSGAETGMYQTSRLRLRLGAERKQFRFIVLSKAMRDGGAFLISLLIGNNLSHYIITSMVTSFFLSQMPDFQNVEVLTTFITAPALFVIAEVIPKNAFFYRADQLMPTVSPILYASHRLFCIIGVVPLLKGISRYVSRLAGASTSPSGVMTNVQRHQLSAILKETGEEGFLSGVQRRMLERLVNISNISVRAVMVPIGKAAMIEKGCSRPELIKKIEDCSFTRLLVYDRYQINVIGFVNIYECLGSEVKFENLEEYIKPARYIEAETSVSDAINLMKNEKLKIALVARKIHGGREKVLGIVTMKDLVEELLGELTAW